MTSTERVGISYQVFDKGKLIVAGGPDSALGVDDWVGFTPVFTPVHKHTYIIKIVAGNIHGDFAHRTPHADHALEASRARSSGRNGRSAAPRRPTPP